MIHEEQENRMKMMMLPPPYFTARVEENRAGRGRDEGRKESENGIIQDIRLGKNQWKEGLETERRRKGEDVRNRDECKE